MFALFIMLSVPLYAQYKKTCSSCGGSGRCSCVGGVDADNCYRCGGSGRCPSCNGSGVIYGDLLDAISGGLKKQSGNNSVAVEHYIIIDGKKIKCTMDANKNLVGVRMPQQGQHTIIYENGDKYIGFFKKGEIHGKGKIYYVNGTVVESTFVNGKAEGKAIIKYANGDSYEGDMKAGDYHGNGRLVEYGREYVGPFVNGKKQGVGTWKSFTGERFEGYFGNDMPASGTWYFRNGDKYEGDINSYGEFVTGGKFTFADGMFYIGEYNNRIPNGSGVLVFTNGDIYNGKVYHDHPLGMGVYYWNNGEQYEGEFNRGLRWGKGKMYYKNFTFDEGIWKAGRLIEKQKGGKWRKEGDIIIEY